MARTRSTKLFFCAISSKHTTQTIFPDSLVMIFAQDPSLNSPKSTIPPPFLSSSKTGRTSAKEKVSTAFLLSRSSYKIQFKKLYK